MSVKTTENTNKNKNIYISQQFLSQVSLDAIS